MVKIKQANIFGRIGELTGQGLAESIPKEAERTRLAAGLERLGQQKNLDPWQQFTGLISQPGITPQAIQTGGEILRQRGISQGFNKAAQEGLPGQGQPLASKPEQPTPLQQFVAPPEAVGSTPAKGLTSPAGTQATLKPYIPMNYQQKVALASQLQQGNPQLYPDAQSALQGAEAIDQSNLQQSQAQQGARKSQIDVEDRIRGQLSGLREASGARIPDNVYQDVENETLNAVEKGKTELEAAKEGRNKLDKISREYNSVQGLGNWTYPFQSPKGATQAIYSLRNDFKKRNDLENFADTLVGENGLSYPKAYYVAYPVEDNPALAKDIKSLKNLHPSLDDAGKETNKLVEKLAKNLGKEGSPLSVAEELRSKGYDPNIWMQYLIKNKRNLDLTERQARELGKTINWLPNLNDVWFFIGSGNEKVLED